MTKSYRMSGSRICLFSCLRLSLIFMLYISLCFCCMGFECSTKFVKKLITLHTLQKLSKGWLLSSFHIVQVPFYPCYFCLTVSYWPTFTIDQRSLRLSLMWCHLNFSPIYGFCPMDRNVYGLHLYSLNLHLHDTFFTSKSFQKQSLTFYEPICKLAAGDSFSDKKYHHTMKEKNCTKKFVGSQIDVSEFFKRSNNTWNHEFMIGFIPLLISNGISYSWA